MTRLLIVEDDVEQARGMARVFGKLRPDLTIVTAHNGVEATRVINERGVDLVLTDLRMPEMDGFALVAWMNNAAPDVPVFTMSDGSDGGEAISTLQGLGAIECFAKPLDARAVLARLSDAISHSVRGHVHNVSLASFLQLLEMERKSCSLTISCEDKTGVLVLQKGALVAARTGELEGQAAAIAIIAWPYPSIAISRQLELAPSPIQASLGFILMEAMRIQDEEARSSLNGHASDSVLPPPPRRTWRPSNAASAWPMVGESSRPLNGDAALPSGARALAVVDTATGRLLHSASRPDFPLGELALMASQVLLHEAAILKLCSDSEGVEELVMSTSSRCDVIRPLGASAFALLIFAPEETNLVMARIELEHFIAAHRPLTAQRTP